MVVFSMVGHFCFVLSPGLYLINSLANNIVVCTNKQKIWAIYAWVTRAGRYLAASILMKESFFHVPSLSMGKEPIFYDKYLA